MDLLANISCTLYISGLCFMPGGTAANKGYECPFRTKTLKQPPILKSSLKQPIIMIMFQENCNFGADKWKGSGTLSIQKCLIKKHTPGKWNNSPHPYKTLPCKILTVSLEQFKTWNLTVSVPAFGFFLI